MGTSYNSNNQLTGVGNVYDGNGDPTTYVAACTTAPTPLTLGYDPDGNLTAYGSQCSAGYSADGLRAWKAGAGGARTYFLYDGASPICELQPGAAPGSAVLTAVNTYGVDGLLSRLTIDPSSGATAVTYYLYDPLGNVAQRLDAHGAVTSQDLYDAWGNRLLVCGAAGNDLSATPPADPFGYKAEAGYYTDSETGLILCTHRYYDPTIGRWLTRDPEGYDGGMDLYVYCMNDPVNGVDPSGLADYPVGEWKIQSAPRSNIFTGTGDFFQGAWDNIYQSLNLIQGYQNACKAIKLFAHLTTEDKKRFIANLPSESIANVFNSINAGHDLNAAVVGYKSVNVIKLIG